MNASEFAKPKDATRRQVQALRPESIDCSDSTPLHHITELPQLHAPGQTSGAGEDTEDPTEAVETATEGGIGGPRRDYRHSTETTCGYCGSWPHKAGEDCKAIGQECLYLW